MFRGAAAFALAAPVLFFLTARADGAGQPPGDWPFARILDTGAASGEPLSEERIAGAGGWTRLAEGDQAHTFRGDAVMGNDRILVVIRRLGAGAEIYSRTAQGMRRRAVLAASPGGAATARRLRELKILENNPGAAALEASYRGAAGDAWAMKLRVTTGQPILEVRPGPGVRALLLDDDPQYLVVPDFFADDMVFGADSLKRPPFGLPAENFLLHLLADGDALAMCVWKSRAGQADARLDESGGRRRLIGCAIRCGPVSPVWFAWLERRGTWARREVPLADPARETVLDWTPPFPAKWRADFVGAGGVCRSSDLAEGEPVDGCCRLENGRAVARVSSSLDAPSHGVAAPLVIYPIDRSRSTPLTALTPMDVLRNTLGVGPCQYILATEGFDPNATPTPAQAMDWIEKQFRRKKEKEEQEAIGELLQQMADHVAEAQIRIGRYAALAEDIQGRCAEWDAGRGVAEADAMARRMKQASALPGEDPAAAARRLAAQLAAQIGRDDALGQCMRIGQSIRRLGARQDRVLAECRMLARRLSQEARALAVANPDQASRAAEIRSKIDDVLKPR